ncbi:MAG: response regulator [Robiginitomaculum sp.]|nr:response regulator [Robiginitomaculum sp.]
MEYGTRIRRMDVMLIDANKVSRGNLGSLIRDFGCYSVRPFEDSETPIVSIINKPPSVVLCHWGSDGEFAAKVLNVIRRHGIDAVAKTPFVIVTRNKNRQIISAGLKAGATHFLDDPVVPADLIKKLTFVLCDKRQMLRHAGKMVYVSAPARQIKKSNAKRNVKIMEFTTKPKVKPKPDPVIAIAPLVATLPETDADEDDVLEL